jgi:hypothetical protein
MEIKLKGIPAILAAVVLIGGMVGYRAFLHSTLPDDPKVRQELEIHLVSEIAGAITADTEKIRARMDSGDNEGAAKLAEGILKRKVEIADLDMRGGGDDIIIRARYIVHGPDAPRPEVGYFKFSHSTITGWRYRRETTALSWYLKVI